MYSVVPNYSIRARWTIQITFLYFLNYLHNFLKCSFMYSPSLKWLFKSLLCAHKFIPLVHFSFFYPSFHSLTAHGFRLIVLLLPHYTFPSVLSSDLPFHAIRESLLHSAFTPKQFIISIWQWRCFHNQFAPGSSFPHTQGSEAMFTFNSQDRCTVPMHCHLCLKVPFFLVYSFPCHILLAQMLASQHVSDISLSPITADYMEWIFLCE